MKKFLFLILLTSAVYQVTLKLEFSIYRCSDDNYFKSDVSAIKNYNYNPSKLYSGIEQEIFIERTCNGKKISFNKDIYYCDEYLDEKINKEFLAKSKKLGESCKLDQDCWDKYYPLICKENECKKKFECEKNQFSYYPNGTDYPYKCKDYAKVDEDYDTPLEEYFQCPPEAVEVRFYKDDKKREGEKYRCIKQFSLNDNTEIIPINDYGAWENAYCKSYHSLVYDDEDNIKREICFSPISDEDCIKNKDGIWKSKIKYSESITDYKEIEEQCETRGENHYLSYDKVTFRKIQYFKNHVLDAFNQLNFDKAREDEVDIEFTKEYYEFNKKYEIYHYFNELFGQKIIDEDGEPLKGKKKCLDFFFGRYAYKDSGRTLKMSISLVLLALLL